VATITLDGIDKIYENGFQAVTDLSLDIEDGEFLVLVGPSGCGKSTALRMIAGLESISGGEMRIGERVVNNLEPKDRDIAMVFQSYALYPHLTVRDNIAFALKLRRCRRTRSNGASPTPHARSNSPTTSIAVRRNCRAANASESRWDARSSVSRRRS